MHNYIHVYIYIIIYIYILCRYVILPFVGGLLGPNDKT